MDKKMNVIYILGDDHRGHAMGSMGDPVVETPHLDSLAKDGAVFERAYCTSPACTPSRCCHYLGQWERKHGVNFESHTAISEEGWQDSFIMKLKAQGYYTGWVGKNHTPVGEGGYDSGYFENKVFDYWYGNHGHSMFYPKEYEGSKGIYDNSKYHTQVEIFEEGVMNFLDPEDDFLSSCKYPLPRRDESKPFCLCVTFNLPHGAGTGTMQMRPEDDEIYKSKYRDRIKDLQLPKTYIPEMIGKKRNRRLPEEIWNGKWITQYDYVKNPSSLRERMVRVYQTVTGMDRMVGHLREKLEGLGLADNTLIVFSTDHGIHWGEHGLGGKCFLYEEDLHIPLIIYNPRMKANYANRRINRMVAVPDIAPTVLDMLGVDVPEAMQGESLIPLIKDDDALWREELFAEQLYVGQNYPKSECLRTEEYKYIRYFKRIEDPESEEYEFRTALDNYQDFLMDSLTEARLPAYEELFDLKKDPCEEHNLAYDDAYKDIMKRMRTRLVKKGLELVNTDGSTQTACDKV